MNSVKKIVTLSAIASSMLFASGVQAQFRNTQNVGKPAQINSAKTPKKSCVYDQESAEPILIIGGSALGKSVNNLSLKDYLQRELKVSSNALELADSRITAESLAGGISQYLKQVSPKTIIIDAVTEELKTKGSLDRKKLWENHLKFLSQIDRSSVKNIFVFTAPSETFGPQSRQDDPMFSEMINYQHAILVQTEVTYLVNDGAGKVDKIFPKDSFLAGSAKQIAGSLLTCTTVEEESTKKP